jgi:hypothetical protein
MLSARKKAFSNKYSLKYYNFVSHLTFTDKFKLMKILRLVLFVFNIFLFNSLFAQQNATAPYKNNPSGLFSFGMRSTLSTFGHNEWSNTGLGAGGALRLQFSRYINTEWFFDYLHTGIQKRAGRDDYHIGWSVMFYPLAGNDDFTKLVKPFILAGHCFDFTRVSENANPANKVQRWSGAIQAGLGAHFNLTPRFDISILGQYMIHLGSDVHAHVFANNVLIEKHKAASLEGHLLFTLGVYYKIADCW